MGIAKRLQGTTKGAAIALGMIERIRRHYQKLGYRHGELSWILEDNRSVQAVIEAIAAVPYKRYRVYAKALAMTGAAPVTALVLAGSRRGEADPVARYRQAAAKCLVDRGRRADAGARGPGPGREPADRHDPGLRRRRGAAGRAARAGTPGRRRARASPGQCRQPQRLGRGRLRHGRSRRCW